MKKLQVGILGATGMVGQQFIQLLSNHPWFEVVCVAASSQSSGQIYGKVVKNRWKLKTEIPYNIKKLKLYAVEKDIKNIANKVDFVFSALNMNSEDIKRIEYAYASLDIPVISNNSACRWINDIPMIIPEVNPEHTQLIDLQRKNHGWKKGFIAVKPNCSIQSYTSVVTALKPFGPKKIHVVSLQAISGAGKTFDIWPEMIDNVIPYIEGEEKKSEDEPLKIWGQMIKGKLKLANRPVISATCIRISVSNGHMACVSVSFEKTPTKKQIIEAVNKFRSPINNLNLPSAPKKLIQYFEDDCRPQTKIDRNYGKGMGITMGRLQKDKHFDWKFVTLSHNTIRGASGGAILLAELLVKKNYLNCKLT